METGHTKFMKAIRLHARGGPEQLVCEDAPLPEPGPGHVRIRVAAAAITPTELLWDETYRHPDGSPRLPSIPGHDFCGTVDSLGPGVTSSSVGQAVYGLIDFPFDGSLAEYVIAPAGGIAPKPNSLDDLHAAAVPLSALTAWQALFDQAKLVAGQRVLIHGAAGAVGGWVVQLARVHGVEIIATASRRHREMLLAAGVKTVIDYNTERFEYLVRDVDAVIDTLGGETRARSWRTLRSGGTLVGLNAPIADQPRDDVKGIFFIVRPNREQLIDIAERIDAGQLQPSVQAVYDLSQTRQAFEFAADGHLSGKIVIRVR